MKIKVIMGVAANYRKLEDEVNSFTSEKVVVDIKVDYFNGVYNGIRQPIVSYTVIYKQEFGKSVSQNDLRFFSLTMILKIENEWG